MLAWRQGRGESCRAGRMPASGELSNLHGSNTYIGLERSFIFGARMPDQGVDPSCPGCTTGTIRMAALRLRLEAPIGLSWLMLPFNRDAGSSRITADPRHPRCAHRSGRQSHIPRIIARIHQTCTESLKRVD